LNSEVLRNAYPFESFFSSVGLSSDLFWKQTSALAENQNADTLTRTHAQSALQTALSAGIVDHCLVAKQPLERNSSLEKSVLSRGEIS
jgi:hypothetical protein